MKTFRIIQSSDLRLGDHILLPSGQASEVIATDTVPDGVKLRDCWTGFEYNYRTGPTADIWRAE